MLKLIVVSFILLFIGCSEDRNIKFEDTNRLSIFVASSGKSAISKVANQFQKIYKDINIDIYSMSSGKGYAQLINGFKYDLYFSADSIYPKKVFDSNLSSSKPKVYAVGILALYSKNIDLLKSGVEGLNNREINFISIANPRLAPYGILAVDILKNYGIYDEVKDKIVKGDNIAQATQFIDIGSADIGIVAFSLINNKTKDHYILIDKKRYKPIQQSFVITKYGDKKDLAKKFANFLLSEKGKILIRESGFEI